MSAGGEVQPAVQDPRKAFGNAVTALAADDERIYVLSADSGGSSGFGEFKKLYPERYLELGIMEQCAVGVAAGLATTGKVPVFSAIAPFTTLRPYEMLRNDVGYMGTNVKINGRNSGISYSDLGSTHHSLEDFAIVRMIPGFVVLAPQDPGEIAAAARAMIEHDGPVYLRLGNDPIPELFEPGPFTIGRGRLLREGGDVTLISTGTVSGAALGAAEILAEQGVSAEVVGLPTVWPLDRDLVAASAVKTGRIVTVEEHYVIGGLGTIVAEFAAEALGVPVTRLGVPHVYAISGPYRELLAHYGLDAASIAASVTGTLA
jgi:transketolase